MSKNCSTPRHDFGPWYDHYVRPFGKCHPDFLTTIINGDDARGVKVCTRRPAPSPVVAPPRPTYDLARPAAVYAPPLVVFDGAGFKFNDAYRRIVW